MLALLAVIPLTLALALPRPSPAATADLTISADPTTVIYGQSTSITGRLKKAPKSGVKVSLEQNPAPYTGGWSSSATRSPRPTAATASPSSTRSRTPTTA